jgi:putative transposase
VGLTRLRENPSLLPALSLWRGQISHAGGKAGKIGSTLVVEKFFFASFYGPAPKSMSGSPISDTQVKVSFRRNLIPEEGGFAVKRKRFSVEQIVAVLKQAELGVPVAELIRQVGITEQTLYRWKKQYKGLETDQVRQLKQLQDENARLKRLVAELTLDKTMLQDVLSKKL